VLKQESQLLRIRYTGELSLSLERLKQAALTPEFIEGLKMLHPVRAVGTP
jgi:hypothetical protein